MHTQPDQPFTNRFRDACRIFPKRTALVCDGKSINYSDLYKQVSRLISWIQRNLKEGSRIGVLDQNDPFTISTFLAINMLGKTWVPLQPDWPEKRLTKLIARAELKTILSSKPHAGGHLNVVTPDLDKEPAAEFPVVPSSSAPAYILFTSGSTGEPKAVPIGNKQLNAFFGFFCDKRNYDFNETDRFLQVYEASFDVSVFSTFCPLFKGAAAVLLPRKQPLYLEIPRVLPEEKITVLSMVPSLLQYWQGHFSEMSFPEVRYSFFSGDKLYADLAETWSRSIPNARIINCYGPTETTIVCTHYPWEKERATLESENNIVPLGKPFPGMEYRIVNDKLQEVQNGEPGELCFHGDQVMDVYLNREGEEKFCNLSTGGTTKRYYRTGDRAKINQQGNLLFLGRTDDQLKVNGYRIEPAELEAAISGIAGARCLTLLKPNTAGISILYAFVEGKGTPDELLSRLKKELPAPWLPRHILFVERIPLNASGKADRQELLKFVP